MPAQSDPQYNIGHYEHYDDDNAQRLNAAVDQFKTFGNFHRSKTSLRPYPDSIKDMPAVGVRLDDLALARVLESNLTNHQLFTYWSADISYDRMPRAAREPLGRAAKMYVAVQERDVDGNVIEEGEEGWYYKWWRGVHCLCGEEGLNADMYLQRAGNELRPLPQHEKFGFKKACKAVIQAAEDADAKSGVPA